MLSQPIRADKGMEIVQKLRAAGLYTPQVDMANLAFSILYNITCVCERLDVLIEQTKPEVK
jgi:hypothetical protein